MVVTFPESMGYLGQEHRCLQRCKGGLAELTILVMEGQDHPVLAWLLRYQSQMGVDAADASAGRT
ncbi:hypothetical protein [Altererythrobacter sp. Root672]|uniref:hypothetical protein n=1 Tax=Altererythrobacter sp. Root672 TaxID=1736584 RepID=UPI0006FC3D71|nr:hypothetical protein [Altererythrobacter sp. Root672]KRA79728.1 hypothetical protein ASD76_17045 [Altererythrobacter sp. Root672]